MPSFAPRYEGPGVFVPDATGVELRPPADLSSLQSATIHPPRPVDGSIHYRIEESLAELWGGEVDRSSWHDVRLPGAKVEVKSCKRVAADDSPARFTVYQHEMKSLREYRGTVAWIVYAQHGFEWDWAVRRQSVEDVPVGWGEEYEWRQSSHRDYWREVTIPWPAVVRPEDCPSPEWHPEG